jgi:hypothetical protein
LINYNKITAAFGAGEMKWGKVLVMGLDGANSFLINK